MVGTYNALHLGVLLVAISHFEIRSLKYPEFLELASYLAIFFTPCRIKVDDNSKLSDCGIRNGTILNLVILIPFEIYMQGVDGRMHTLTVPSSEPDVRSFH